MTEFETIYREYFRDVELLSSIILPILSVV